MSVIAVTPIVLKDCVVEFGSSDFAAAISAVTFTPSSSVVTFKGLKKGSVHTDVTDATWVCGITNAQDWANPDSLSNYLHEHEGETEDVTFRPQSGVGPTITAEIVITPGAIGGAIDSTAVSTVNLGSTKPEIVPAAP